MNEQKIKIAISIWMFEPGTGGLQSHAESLAKHLIAQGHEFQCLPVPTLRFLRG